ncbi:MAG: dienelactone hydrolase family protein [Bacteroidales bacterium]
MFLVCAQDSLFSQKLVTFRASDGLTVTADLYETDIESQRYLLLFHQAEYSRGEFKQIATRLIKLGFNCLAVDLRYGNEVNFINNETAMRARQGSYDVSMLDAKRDMVAAIQYVHTLQDSARIFLLGSSYSASLALVLAQEREDVEAVIAFSPGEFFGAQLNVENTLRGLDKPIFVGCPRSEYFYVSQLLSGVTSSNKVVFRPQSSDGLHGAKTLWWESATRDEFWLSLLFFLKDFKE